MFSKHQLIKQFLKADSVLTEVLEHQRSLKWEVESFGNQRIFQIIRFLSEMAKMWSHSCSTPNMVHIVGFWDCEVGKACVSGLLLKLQRGTRWGGQLPGWLSTLTLLHFLHLYLKLLVSTQSSQTLAKSGNQAAFSGSLYSSGGASSVKVLSWDPGCAFHNPLLPLIVFPSWPLSVKTAHLLCWTQAFLRCKCEVESFGNQGRGAVGG